MFGFGKKKVAQGSNWRELERVAAKSKVYKGHKVKTQKTFRSTRKRPDIFALDKKNPRKRLVGDAKCVKEVTRAHVDQVAGYMKHPAYAKEGHIHTCKESKVSHKVRKYAKAKRILIHRTSVKRKKSFWG